MTALSDADYARLTGMIARRMVTGGASDDEIRGMSGAFASLLTERQVVPERIASSVRSAQWAAFDKVLHWINEQTEKRISKGDLYDAVMKMRPADDTLAAQLAEAEAKGLRRAAECCDAAQAGAEQHYGVAESVGAAMAKVRILALIPTPPTRDADDAG